MSLLEKPAVFKFRTMVSVCDAVAVQKTDLDMICSCESVVKVVDWLGLVRQAAVQGILLSEHFGDEENDDRSKDASARQQVHERIPGSRQ